MLSNLAVWKRLHEHYQEIKEVKLAAYFLDPTKRYQDFSIGIEHILFDYSKNFISHETINLLLALAKERNLPSKIQQLFAGAIVNPSENAPALHVALRDPTATPLLVSGSDIKPLITNTLTKMAGIVNKIHMAQLCGLSHKSFCHIVTIGIGGSYLGPQLTTHALTEYTVNSSIKLHFIADIDDFATAAVLQHLDPERTLFVIESKSFTTLETMHNTQIALGWLQQQLDKIVPQLKIQKHQLLATHFIAVTAQPQIAKDFGINEDFIMPFWDWVGGRYSIWSAIALPLAVQIGMNNFIDFLAGAYLADQHFLSAAMHKNIPIIMALLGVWYINFFNANTHAIIAYDARLQYLLPYLQQLDMESNGKNITCGGELVDYSTGPILWGGLGIGGQHAFYQLLHQGTHLSPIDFIVVKQKTKPQLSLEYSSIASQDLLVANARCQAQSLLYGTGTNKLSFTNIPGNRPSNMMVLDKLTPQSLGTLLALYEHKIFVQSVIWDINPFDQFGVALGKTMLADVINEQLLK